METFLYCGSELRQVDSALAGSAGDREHPVFT
jgi:hypothetical protein